MTIDSHRNALSARSLYVDGIHAHAVLWIQVVGDAAVAGRPGQDETTVHAQKHNSQSCKYVRLCFSRGISHVRPHLVRRLLVAFRLCTAGGGGSCGPCKLGHVGMVG